jgi:hypothetical protein
MYQLTLYRQTISEDDVELVSRDHPSPKLVLDKAVINSTHCLHKDFVIGIVIDYLNLEFTMSSEMMQLQQSEDVGILKTELRKKLKHS